MCLCAAAIKQLELYIYIDLNTYVLTSKRNIDNTYNSAESNGQILRMPRASVRARVEARRDPSRNRRKLLTILLEASAQQQLKYKQQRCV